MMQSVINNPQRLPGKVLDNPVLAHAAKKSITSDPLRVTYMTSEEIRDAGILVVDEVPSRDVATSPQQPAQPVTPETPPANPDLADVPDPGDVPDGFDALFS